MTDHRLDPIGPGACDPAAREDLPPSSEAELEKLFDDYKAIMAKGRGAPSTIMLRGRVYHLARDPGDGAVVGDWTKGAWRRVGRLLYLSCDDYEQTLSVREWEPVPPGSSARAGLTRRTMKGAVDTLRRMFWDVIEGKTEPAVFWYVGAGRCIKVTVEVDEIK